MKLNFVLVARFVEGPLGVAGSERSGAGGPVLAYERFAGAARGPLTGQWRRREPERTVLHATVRAHLRTFLEEARARTDEGLGLPRFVEAEFERYLACGILAHGFARVRCERCGDELLVAFSCKGRGFCPSCTTRRMHDTAARLVDGALPRVPVRQWVLSLPRWARWLLARDPRLAGRTLEVALRAIFASLRRRARREGVRDARAGAVTFVQRFGGALNLNLNVHFHCVVPDGVFAGEEAMVRFVPLGGPPDEEVEAILRRVVVRLLRLLRPRAERMDLEQPDALANAQAEALLLPSAVPQEPPRRKQHSAFLEGFSLHAGVHLHANDREALQRLCAYGARPPLSLERLAALPDGRLAYRLKRPLRDGRQVLVLQPTEFLRR
jgi:putative transposase/transposase-like zinc-binding protein